MLSGQIYLENQRVSKGKIELNFATFSPLHRARALHVARFFFALPSVFEPATPAYNPHGYGVQIWPVIQV
ncbi:MAG: hypothetical protein D3910_07535 [Candidatus Electrothrix sp. ATG2]|nr:hypothetical protein [Candidatus Electrothrix sp. ATG2]